MNSSNIDNSEACKEQEVSFTNNERPKIIEATADSHFKKVPREHTHNIITIGNGKKKLVSYLIMARELLVDDNFAEVEIHALGEAITTQLKIVRILEMNGVARKTQVHTESFAQSDTRCPKLIVTLKRTENWQEAYKAIDDRIAEKRSKGELILKPVDVPCSSNSATEGTSSQES